MENYENLGTIGEGCVTPFDMQMAVGGFVCQAQFFLVCQRLYPHVDRERDAR